MTKTMSKKSFDFSMRRSNVTYTLGRLLHTCAAIFYCSTTENIYYGCPIGEHMLLVMRMMMYADATAETGCAIALRFVYDEAHMACNFTLMSGDIVEIITFRDV